MKGLSLEQMEFLAGKGLSLADVIELAKMGDNGRSKGAERQARYRRRKKGVDTADAHCDVTGDVTGDASLPPYEVSTPPVSSDEETIPPAKVTKLIPAKPEGVKDQTWQDFIDLRKRKRAPLTQTALDGIAAEAAKVGWSMESTLSKCVTRGWQGFEAEWVNAAKPPGEPGDNLVRNILGKQPA